VTKILYLLTLFAQAVTFFINKHTERETEKKYEEARTTPNDVWVDGFGMRRETKDDPTKTSADQ
jgi:hypothetical protein